MSKPNTIDPTHEDANGLCTHVCMLDGFKFWLYGDHQPHKSPLPVLAPDSCKRDWHFAKFMGYFAVGIVLGSVSSSDHLCVLIFIVMSCCGSGYFHIN